MWLFTQHGFYSVVADGTDREYVFVRSRSAQHLHNLKLKFNFEDYTIAHTPNQDYPYRMRMKRQRWLSLATDLASDVKYTNYKTAAAKNIKDAGPRFVHVLHGIWETLYQAFQVQRHTGD